MSSSSSSSLLLVSTIHGCQWRRHGARVARRRRQAAAGRRDVPAPGPPLATGSVPPPGARRCQPPDLREAKPGREREAERAGGQVLVAHGGARCPPCKHTDSISFYLDRAIEFQFQNTAAAGHGSKLGQLTGRGGPGSGGAGARCRPRRP